MRPLLLCGCLTALACGAQVQSSPEPRPTTAAAPAPAAAPPPAPATSGSDAGAAQDAAPIAQSTPDAGPIDHMRAPCPAGTPSYSVVAAARFGDSPFMGTVRASAAPVREVGSRVANSIRATPGQIVTLEVTIQNAGAEALTLSAADIAGLRTVQVMGSTATWTANATLGGDGRRGRRLAPGAELRLCLDFDVGTEPIDAAPPSSGTERAYRLDWASEVHRHPLTLGSVYVTVRYRRDDRPAIREASSWGGVIALELREGASLVDIARATGVRIGAGARPFGRDPVRPRDYVQAPPHMRVAAAAAALRARDDVLRATPLMRGDPGTEGCSENSPCPRGQQCCYLCGIAGCPNSCYAGRECPRDIP